MISGLYTATSGLIAQTQQQDVIANNLANINTTGYKKDRTLFIPFPTVFLHRINDDKQVMPGGGMADMLTPVGQMGRGVQLRVDGIQPELTTEGSFVETGNKLDFAVKGNGMFVVATPNGIRYTRDGSFHVDVDGRLVTRNGNAVMGQSGDIILDGNEVHVDEGGRIFVDNQEIDTFRIGVFSKETVLRKEGDNLFFIPDGSMLEEDDYVETVQVMQGFTEASNVNAVREMVDMISAYRAYEASQKAVQAQDQTLSKAVNDVGNIQL